MDIAFIRLETAQKGDVCSIEIEYIDKKGGAK